MSRTLVSPKQQAGMSMWQLIVVIALIAFFATVGIKSVPIYLNQMKVTKAVKSVAGESGSDKYSPVQVRKALQKHWDIDDVKRISVAEVKIVRLKGGQKVLSYTYEAKERLFYNVSMVFEFAEQIPMGKGG